ncbi:hypothetical protein [Bradyrhizobium sp. Cp5.3]|uniref:hypothetical protein n=1 Tax=Bradyrhizobium sp. Cp5.3 TaxID=443598 RepID=UPI000418B825|nr:hypothetical protein [Bradyrhizobium sp. Cp5.3]
MTTHPFYEPRILKMELEKFADIAVDGGVWLVGEVLAQGPSMSCEFTPDTRYVFKPRHREAAIIELRAINEELRHRIFIAGFLRLPNNGAQATFRYVCETHTEMLHEAFRIEWTRRHGKMIDVSKMRSKAAIELLHKLAPPR